MTTKRVKIHAKKLRAKFSRKWYRQNLAIFGCLLLVVIGLSVGYSVLSRVMNVTGSARVRANADLRIIDIEKLPGGCGVDVYPPEYTVDTITMSGDLPQLGCSITYNVTIRNRTDMLIVVSNIIEEAHNNPAISYTFNDMSVGTIINPESELVFQITFNYNVATLPAKTDFGTILKFEFQEAIKPVLAWSAAARNYEMYTRLPDAGSPTISALDDLDGDISSQITKTCTVDGSAVACPSGNPPYNFRLHPHGQYAVTYNVKNSIGLAADPITINTLVWDFVKIAEGDYHTMALSSLGKVWIFGYNANYRLGLNDTTRRLSPVPQTYLTPEIVDISAARESSVALDVDGNLWAWGYNGNYALGDNTTTQRQTPVKVTPPSGVKFVQISEFSQTGAALTSDGDIYIWGNGAYGVPGFGNDTNVRVPTKLANLPKMKKVAMGQYAGAAIAENGDLYMWGNNNYGKFGVGFDAAGTSPTGLTVTTSNNTPKKYINLPNVKDVSVGYYHTAAVTENGTAYTWGNGDYGRLCNGSTSNNYSPYVVSQITNATAVVTNVYNTIFMTTDGKAYACGSGNYGEVQNGSTTGNITSPSLNTGYSNVAGVSFGLDTSHILTADSMVVGYGYSGNGECGCNSASSSTAARDWNFTVPPIVAW